MKFVYVVNTMSNKTKIIKIDPIVLNQKSLTKTKKNIKPAPLISPSALKSTFLKRIKEHKNKSLAKQPSLVDDSSDEFNDSMDYLKKLSDDRDDKSKKNNTTVKNYAPVYGGLTNMPEVYLELDDNLKEIQVQATDKIPSMHLKSNAEIPYSNLRVGGSKPTYREWTKTQKNIHSTNQIVIGQNDINKQVSERELRLNALKNKIKQKQEVKPVDVPRVIQNLEIHTPIIPAPMLTVSDPIAIQSSSTQLTEPVREIIDNVKDTSYVSKIINKTMRYTIGKSKMKQRVGVLLKDRGTRKNVLSAQKELKRKSMKDIKNYLKDHNLIKVGSNAPNDVLRQLFESSMMSGDIMNKNKETMLTNFMTIDQ
jgi:hypothetical protein